MVHFTGYFREDFVMIVLKEWGRRIGQFVTCAVIEVSIASIQKSIIYLINPLLQVKLCRSVKKLITDQLLDKLFQTSTYPELLYRSRAPLHITGPKVLWRSIG